MRKFYLSSWRLLATLFVLLSAGVSNAQQYCTSGLYSTGCTNSDYILAITSTGGTTNISNTQSIGCSNTSTAYTYFSTQNLVATVGTTCSLSISVGPYSEYVVVYVDWNADGDFVDAGEGVLGGTVSASGTGSGPITVPAGTTNGTKRMRVRCVYGGSTSVTACSLENEGEVEDYNFIVGCIQPSNLAVSNITATGATFSWQAASGASGYEYVLDNSSSNPTTGAQAAGASPFTVSNLMPATSYYFHLRATCGAGGTSSWVTVPFTTVAAPCLAPATVTVTNNSNSATITWPSAGSVAGYETANTTSVTPPTSGTATTSLTALYTGLAANTVYYAHVRSSCSGVFSPWQTQVYSTAANGVANTAQGGVRLSVTPNPAGSWIAVRAEGVSAGSTAVLTISDVAGRVLRSVSITGKETEVSLADVPAGLYLLRYSSADHTGVTRIQKL